jgi:hypothetical protein
MSRLTLLLALALSSFARAERGSIKSGIAAFEALEYERAVALLHQALAGSLSLDEKLTVLRTLAFTHVALAQDDRARAEFRLLLRIDPGTQLDQTISPRARLLLEEARIDLGRELGPEPVSLRPTFSPSPLAPGQTLTVNSTAPRAAGALFFFRAPGQTGFHRATAQARDGQVAITVPGLEVKPPALEYYLLTMDLNEAVTGRAGAPERPLTVEVPASPSAAAKPPLYRRGWIWGAAAGASAAIIFVGALAGALAEPSGTRISISHP